MPDQEELMVLIEDGGSVKQAVVEGRRNIASDKNYVSMSREIWQITSN